MAKKGAKFYYEKEPITSDKAIEILKKNKKLHIHTQNTNNSKYSVYISKIETKNSNFSVIFEKNKNDINMICKKGCEWKELNFNLELNTPKIVNKYGLNKVNQRNKDDSFYFVLIQDKNVFDLKSTKNTKWKGLSGASDEKMKLFIDQNTVKLVK